MIATCSRSDPPHMTRRPTRSRKSRKTPAATPPSEAAKAPIDRARDLAERGMFRDAFDLVGGILAADPTNWRAKHLMALILWSSNLRDKAVPLMAEAVAASPDTAEIRTACVPEFLHMAAKSGLESDAALALAEQAVARHGPTWPLLED